MIQLYSLFNNLPGHRPMWHFHTAYKKYMSIYKWKTALTQHLKYVQNCQILVLVTFGNNIYMVYNL